MSDAVKMRNNIVYYEERKKMENTKRQNTDGNHIESEGQQSGNGAKKSKNSGFLQSISENAKSLSVILGFAGTIAGFSLVFSRQGNDIENLQNSVERIEGNIKESNDESEKGFGKLEEAIDELSALVVNDHEIFLDLSSKETGEKAYSVVFKDAFQVKTETLYSEVYLAAPSWKEGENAIACDTNSDDIIYSAEDLCNTPIVTSYMKDGNEVYFYGRYNENNHWNGKCILNVYNNDKLLYIFEGIYDDGDLFSYKRLDDKGDIWLVNDRIYQGEYNSGETWKYIKTEDFTKDFLMEEVKEKQIITVDRFLNSKEPELISYYRGNTANGVYDDDNGNAYLVLYFKNGELPGAEGQRVIRTLYQGCFEKGTLCDHTGNAWYITREADTTYMFYEGSFSISDDEKGRPDHIIEKENENFIGQDYIKDKLEEKRFQKYSSEFWIEYKITE